MLKKIFKAASFLAFSVFLASTTIFSGIPAYSSASNQIITEYGKQNMFATQVQTQLVENYSNYPEEAEKTNGRWAMIGMIALLGAYITTGQIIPGIF